MSKIRKGTQVEWTGYEEKTFTGHVDSFTDHGMMLRTSESHVPWQAKKIDGTWCAYSGGGNFHFPLKRTVKPST